VNITPPVGLELSGGWFGPSVGIHDELYAKALILESGGDTVGLITADLIGFGTRYADRIRAGAAERLGTSPRNVMVSCSHTHSGPGTMKLREWGALGDTALVCLPAELFVEIGLNIKAASPFPHTFIVELANGSISYIPTRAEFKRGGYEMDLASKVYGLYTLTPDVQEVVEKAAG